MHHGVCSETVMPTAKTLHTGGWLRSGISYQPLACAFAASKSLTTTLAPCWANRMAACSRRWHRRRHLAQRQAQAVHRRAGQGSNWPPLSAAKKHRAKGKPHRLADATSRASDDGHLIQQQPTRLEIEALGMPHSSVAAAAAAAGRRGGGTAAAAGDRLLSKAAGAPCAIAGALQVRRQAGKPLRSGLRHGVLWTQSGGFQETMKRTWRYCNANCGSLVPVATL